MREFEIHHTIVGEFCADDVYIFADFNLQGHN